MNKINIITVLVIFLFSCENLEDYSPKEQAKKLGEIIEFKVNRDTLLANASDTTKLTVLFIKEVEESKAEVKYSVTNGSIKESGNKEYDINAAYSENNNFENQITEATFISSNQGQTNVIVSVKIGALTLYDTIYYNQMAVSSISFNLSQFQLVNSFDSTLLITGIAESDSGKPTKGQKINVSVHDSTFKMISSELNFKSENLKTDENGGVSVLFSSGNINYEGKAFIIANLEGNGSSIADTTILFLKNPL